MCNCIKSIDGLKKKMLVNFLRHIGNKYGLEKVRFEKKARDIALEKDDNPCFFENMTLSKEESNVFLACKEAFGTLFFEKDAPYLLWVSKCLHVESCTLLSIMSSYIRSIQTTKRGGLNTYKRIGWDAHVLYVCQLASSNFAEGIPSCAYNWNFDVQYIFDYFKNVYIPLSKSSRFIIKIGSFLHDIGVTLGVKDHEEKGVPLTEKYYKEIGISAESLTVEGIALTTDEIICIICAIVGNHQIINQISAEASDRYIYEKISTIKQSFSFSTCLMELFKVEFVDVMLLLATADMMAVDDSLLSVEKFEELVEARTFLQRISNNGDYEREHQKYGVKRLISLLPDANKKDAEKIIFSYIHSQENSHSLYEFLYNVKFISYAMAAIKPLNDTLKSIKLIDWCKRIAQTVKMPFSDLIFKFDTDIDTEKLGRILVLDVKEIIELGLINSSYDKDNGIIEVNINGG